MAAGMMYIANSFKTVGRTANERTHWPADNDPHFWCSPPTWGICRPDLRKKVLPGQTIFFVLSKYAQHPQMIFGYMKVFEVVSHLAAHRKLPQKRMCGLFPDGNIIVNAAGGYNRWDAWSHEHNFQKIRGRYAIGDPAASRFLTPQQIASKAPQFLAILKEVLGGQGDRAIDYISRAGRQALTGEQVRALTSWIDSGLPDQDRGFGVEQDSRAHRVVRRRCLPSVCAPVEICVPNTCGPVVCNPSLVPTSRVCPPRAGRAQPRNCGSFKQ